ncbi:uncharacterized protein LOC119179373 isoform X2 [Rhipicephalus microplus]
MFDSDLDDFVDLAPEDDIPNKAKLRVVSRSTSILCNAAAVAAGQNVAPSCSQDSCAIQPAPIREQGEVVLQACEAAIQEDGSDAMETSQALLIVTRIEDAPCAVLSYRQMSGSDEVQIEDAAISHASMHDNEDHLKFQLPPSFGIWCDTFLRSKQPVTAKVKTHIISHLFKACYRMTSCSTPRLYNKVLDSLVAKYPHVMEGKYNRRRWLIALRSRFKSERENLTGPSAATVEAQETSGLDLSQPDADDACTYAHTQHAKTQLSSSAYSPGCEDKSVHEEHLGEFTNASAHGAETYIADTLPLDSMCPVSDSVECLESEDDEESMDCPNHSDGLLEDETVSSLLRSCTDEKASEALMAQQESQASLDESESCDEPTEEIGPSESKPTTEAVRSAFHKNPLVSNGEAKTIKVVLKNCGELEKNSEGNRNGLPLKDRASRATVLPGTLRGRSSSTDSSESEKQNENFSFQFEGLPKYIRKALKAQRPLPSAERRALVRCVVEQLTEVYPYPSRDLIREVAITIVDAFPEALKDRDLDGEMLGKGHNSFFQQLKCRADTIALGRLSPDTSPGFSGSMHLHESEGQYGNVSFYLEYLPEHIRSSLKVERPLPHRERRALVRCVIEKLTTMCARPRRDLLRGAATTVVRAFPDALEDRGLDGSVLGRGYDSFFHQLECRAENIRRKEKGAVAPVAQRGSRKTVKNTFGCVNWQPVRNSEPPEDIEDRIQFLKQEGKKSLEEIDMLLCVDYMEETYPELRSFVNADPAPGISVVKDQWPMLFHRPFFYRHGNELLAKNVKAIFDQKVSTYAPPLIQYLESVPKKEVMYTLMIMREAAKKGNMKSAEEAVPPLLCTYFKEDERHLFQVLEEEKDIAEMLHELPCTPTIVALGGIFQKKCFVACEREILFTEPVDFSEATCLLLLSYYVFNLAYADPVATTLEFLQREMFTVNPLRGSKCSNGRKSRTSVSNKIMRLMQHLR